MKKAAETSTTSKKARMTRTVSTAKTVASRADAGAFLRAVEDPQRRRDCETVREIMAAATGAPAVMWGSAIVGLGSYHYRYDSGREGDAPLVGFSPRKNEITLYITPGFERFAALLGKLGPHRTGKGCLYLQRLEDVDLEALRAIVQGAVAEMAPRRTDK